MGFNFHRAVVSEARFTAQKDLAGVDNFARSELGATRVKVSAPSWAPLRVNHLGVGVVRVNHFIRTRQFTYKRFIVKQY